MILAALAVFITYQTDSFYILQSVMDCYDTSSPGRVYVLPLRSTHPIF